LNGITARLDRLPAAVPGRTSQWLWTIAIGGLLIGIVSWATWTMQGGVIALWSFTVTAIAVALVLPFPRALVSPLFVGIAGWLVDMLPFVILMGWATVVMRWAFGLWRARRLPRGGRWIWLPLGLVVWTALGITQIDLSMDLKHFVLLLGIQVLASGVMLAAVDSLAELRDRTVTASGLVLFVVVLSVVVFAEWIGAPIQEMQNDEIRKRVEESYGVDAFPNNLGLMKYARSSKGGAREFRAQMERFAARHPDVPDFEVFLPKFQAFETTNVVVRFDSSARELEDELEQVGRGVTLIYDNVGLSPANTVPRMRSLARNSLTYAGSCVALFFLAFFLAWRREGRARLLGRLGVAACLFGAGFSLARGAWVAIPIGIIYIAVDGVISGRRKQALVGAFLAGAAVLAAVFLVKYNVDPINARAGGEASIATRGNVYEDTVGAVNGLHFAIGYGTERPRTESGVSHELGRYIPKAGTHSTYLNYLFRTGVPGALAVLALYLVAALHSRAAARTSSGDERVLNVLLAGAILAAAAHAVILSLYVEPIYTLVISLIIGLGMAGAAQLPISVWPWRTREVAS